MKPGYKTSEYWMAIIVLAFIGSMVWTKRYPAYGDPGYDGITYMVSILAGFTGVRTIVKWNNPLADATDTTVASTKKTESTTVQQTSPPPVVVPMPEPEKKL